MGCGQTTFQQLMLLMVLPLASAAEPLSPPENAGRYVGVFSNVAVSKMSGDCGGFSVQLWELKRERASAGQLTGYLYDAGGTCPGQPYAIPATRVGKNGRSIEFEAISSHDPSKRFRVSGTLSSGCLSGDLTYVDLEMAQPQPMGKVRLPRRAHDAWSRL